MMASESTLVFHRWGNLFRALYMKYLFIDLVMESRTAVFIRLRSGNPGVYGAAIIQLRPPHPFSS